MMPIYHFSFGFIFSFILYLIFPSIGPTGFYLIFLSSVFIDIDHYFRYVHKTGNLNPIYFWYWSVSEHRVEKRVRHIEDYKYPFLAFHGIEFILILAIAAIFSKLAMSLLIGSAFHLFLDYLDLLPKSKRSLLSKFSQIYVLKRNKYFPHI